MHGNRTRLKQELEKQRLELDRRRDEEEARQRREMAVVHQSSSMDVPSPHTPQTPTVNVEVPTTILEVRSKLQHPTSYHVNAIQKRQVQQYLTQQGIPLQSRSAPLQHTGGLSGRGNLTSMSMREDPMLSGGMNHSPIKASPMGSGAIFGSQPTTINLKPPESPTVMMTDQTPEDIQEQIIEDIMGLEEKFGDTLGGMPYLESGMMAPQTLPVTTNLFDQFGMSSTSPGAVVMSQMSTSCPTNVKEEQLLSPGQPGSEFGPFDMKQFEKERQKKNNHNMIERRRRFNINDRIKELGTLLPASEAESRHNKGTILKASVDYIRKLQRDMHKMKVHDSKQRALEETNRQMRLRIQELELTARAHGIPTPSLNPETQKLAHAAEQALGSYGTITPRSKSPGSTSVTPVFGNDDLADYLRSSPGIDFSRLNIKQEPVESPSPCAANALSPSPRPRPPSNNFEQRPGGDIFSFNIPLTTSSSQLTSSHNPMDTSVHLFGNT